MACDPGTTGSISIEGQALMGAKSFTRTDWVSPGGVMRKSWYSVQLPVELAEVSTPAEALSPGRSTISGSSL